MGEQFISLNLKQSYTFDSVLFGGHLCCYLGSWSNPMSSHRQHEVTQNDVNNKVMFHWSSWCTELMYLISDPLHNFQKSFWAI